MPFSNLGGYAIITGAGGGIGRETAYTFAEAGAQGILLADINAEAIEESAAGCKKYATNSSFKVSTFEVDIANPESVQRMVETAQKEFGRIDYAINSAGVGPTSKKGISDLDLDEFDKLHNVNARGTLIFVRAVSKAMIEQDERLIEGRNGTRNVGRGSIVAVASAFSYLAAPGHLPYVTAKHAVMGIVKASALDLASYKVRVNGMCPTWVNTPMVAKARLIRPELDILAASNPFGRPADTEEVAEAILFLCSPSSTYTTASGMVIDAGLLIEAPIIRQTNQ